MATLKLRKIPKSASTGASSKKPSSARGATVALSAAARRRGRVADPDAADKPARQPRTARNDEGVRKSAPPGDKRERAAPRSGEAPRGRASEAPARRSSEAPARRGSENPHASRAPRDSDKSSRGFNSERGQRSPHRSDERSSAGASDARSRPRQSPSGDRERPARRDGESPPIRRRSEAPARRGSENPRASRAPRDSDESSRGVNSDRPPRRDRESYAPARTRDDAPRGDTRRDARSGKTKNTSRHGPDVRGKNDATPHTAQTPRINMQEGIRLSKRISEEGLASRREADEWIERGWVKVDGKIVAELGTRVLPTQQITVDERARNQQAQQVTILLNKPVGYVSGQAEDGHSPAVTLIKPENHWAEDNLKLRLTHEHLRGLAPAGRLDIDSVGLLVLTQNGRVAKQLIGANSKIDKEYLVRVKYLRGEQLPEDQLALLNHGLELDGVPLQPAHVEWQNEDQLRFVLREGKKRQIRRMCEMVGLEVLGLKRVRIGHVRLGGLPTGQWRYLGPDETFWAD